MTAAVTQREVLGRRLMGSWEKTVPKVRTMTLSDSLDPGYSSANLGFPPAFPRPQNGIF